MQPTQDELEALITPGSVLFLKNTFSDSDKPHFHVILNYPFGLYADIASVNSTTNIVGAKERVKNRRHNPLSLIESDKCPDTPFLSEPSIFDCNSPTPLTKIEIIEKYYCGDWNLKMLSKVSESFLAKLIEATKSGKGPPFLRFLFFG